MGLFWVGASKEVAVLHVQMEDGARCPASCVFAPRWLWLGLGWQNAGGPREKWPMAPRGLCESDIYCTSKVEWHILRHDKSSLEGRSTSPWRAALNRSGPLGKLCLALRLVPPSEV